MRALQGAHGCEITVAVVQSSGFEHFDGNHRENFASALILLCLDEDSSFRVAMQGLLGEMASLPTGTALTSWGREVGLEVEGVVSRRSDLWLCFGGHLVLVEVKTHSAWLALDVARQIADQRTSRLRSRAISAAILLAPSQLLRADDLRVSVITGSRVRSVKTAAA
jgi:hypothetical protein